MALDSKNYYSKKRVHLEDKISQKILNQFNVINLYIENESHMHGGSAGDSHFKVVLISDDFKELSLMERHKAVYDLLSVEMNNIHALSLHLFSGDENFQRVSRKNPINGSKSYDKKIRAAIILIDLSVYF